MKKFKFFLMVQNTILSILCISVGGFVNGIYGGRVVAKNAFPNMAAVFSRITEESELEMISAGTIYTKNWILISGLACSQIDVKYPKKYVIVKVGKPNFRLTEPYEQVRSILEFHLHREYHSTVIGISVDAGLIKLNASLILNEYVNIIPYSRLLNYPSGCAEVVGWGVSNPIEIQMGVLSNVLLSAFVHIMTYTQCKFSISFQHLMNGIQLPPEFLDRYHFCTGSFADTVGPSKGDNGGPILQKDSNGNYNVIAVISGWPQPPGAVGPSVYIRIAPLYYWMRSITGEIQ